MTSRFQIEILICGSLNCVANRLVSSNGFVSLIMKFGVIEGFCVMESSRMSFLIPNQHMTVEAREMLNRCIAEEPTVAAVDFEPGG